MPFGTTQTIKHWTNTKPWDDQRKNEHVARTALLMLKSDPEAVHKRARSIWTSARSDQPQTRGADDKKREQSRGPPRHKAKCDLADNNPPSYG